MTPIRLFVLILTAAITFAQPAKAADYVVDTKGMHAFIAFKISHLGFSFILGRFDTFTGRFSFDDKTPAASKVVIDIDTASVNTNHAKRDKHLRSEDFLNVGRFPTAKFVSTSVTPTGKETAKVFGNLTLMGVTKEVVIDARRVGGGDDPWGGYRQGFAGTTAIDMKDFPFKKKYGRIEFDLVLEGIRQ